MYVICCFDFIFVKDLLRDKDGLRSVLKWRLIWLRRVVDGDFDQWISKCLTDVLLIVFIVRCFVHSIHHVTHANAVLDLLQ